MKSRIAIALVVACAFSGALGAAWGLQPRALAQDEQQASEGQSVWDGVYTEEQARRGEALYQKDCSTCHGDRLNGTGEAPALSGGGFLSNWNGLTVGDLFERIRTTMPLDVPGKLSRQQNADAIAFILKANGWPAGATDLPPDPAALKQIRILSVKVQ